MENRTKTITIKNEESMLKKGRRDYMVFDSEYLVPGRIMEHDDSFDLELDVTGLEPFTAIGAGNTPEKYRLLIACAKLEKLRIDYTFSMEPENLMYDVNFIPKVMKRDGNTDTSKDDFLNEYKALIGSTIKSSYSYKDFYEGGGDLYGKDKFLSKISDAADTVEIVDLLSNEYYILQEKMGKDKILVNNKKYKRTKRSIPIMIVLIVLMSACLCWIFIFDIPDKNIQIDVSDNYLAQDYIKVLDVLKDTDANDMTDEVRYMAAISGVYTASLNDKQRDQILDGITLKTDALVLDYWVEMGKGNYSQAVDIAQRIGNEELELYGLIIEKDTIEIDTSITGARKTEKLNALDEQITTLEEKINPKEEGDAQ